MAELRELKLSFGRKQADNSLFLTPIESATHAYHLFNEKYNDIKIKKFICAYLTDKYEIISFEVIPIETQTYARPDSMKILRGAIIHNSPRILTIHNHPFNPSELSMTDIRNARDLKEKGAILNIRLQDEIIIGDRGFVSLAERGLI